MKRCLTTNKVHVADFENFNGLELSYVTGFIRVIIFECFCDNRLIDLARKLDKADRESLTKCAMYLGKMEQYFYAAEVYNKMGDHKALINLHVEAKHWEHVSCLNMNSPTISITG